MRKCYHYIIIICTFTFLSGCKLDSTNTENSANTIHIFEYPNSELQFPLSIPIQNLSNILNSAIPDQLVDTKMSIGKKNDSLELKIFRKGKIFFESKGSEVVTNIPLEISATINKKMLGLSLTNKKPIVFSLVLEISSELKISDEWQLEAICNIKNIRWMQKPSIKLLVANILLDKLVEEQIEKNKDKLENAICAQLPKSVDLRKYVSQVWDIMCKPQKVVQSPVELYFHSAPIYFSAAFDPNAKDTLKINVLSRSKMSISTDKKSILNNSDSELPLNMRRVNQSNGIIASPVFVLPIKSLDAILNQKLKNASYKYAEYEVRIESIQSKVIDNQLVISIQVKGEIEAEIIAQGVPTLSSEKSLSIEGFKYEIVSDNMLLSAADWLTNDSFKEYILERANFPLHNIFESIDSKIENALNQSKTGDVLDLSLDLEFLDKNKLTLTRDKLYWVFYLKGKSQIIITP